MNIEFRSPPNPPPQPEPPPQVDTHRRYDVYCVDPNRAIVVYRNALFKGASCLFPGAGGRIVHHDFVELEQANGESVFISRTCIFRFCEPGTTVIAEVVASNKDVR